MYKLDPPALLFETSRPGRSTFLLPECDVPDRPLEELIPAAHQASEPPHLPELGELDVVRHYTNLSTMNMAIDANFYPLGSCTMKYNPKRNERLASLPGLLKLHPYQDESTLQGMLALLYELQHDLAEIAGLDAVSLQPAAGRRGNWRRFWWRRRISGIRSRRGRRFWCRIVLTARIRPRHTWPGSTH